MENLAISIPYLSVGKDRKLAVGMVCPAFLSLFLHHLARIWIYSVFPLLCYDFSVFHSVLLVLMKVIVEEISVRAAWNSLAKALSGASVDWEGWNGVTDSGEFIWEKYGFKKGGLVAEGWELPIRNKLRSLLWTHRLSQINWVWPLGAGLAFAKLVASEIGQAVCWVAFLGNQI